uniref:NADH-ubiquinone oxidoreductase chain 4 n=1 Tax=Macrocheles glaber TaxID=99226 RepID=A0A6B9WFN8_9ACAR|nr:NADH dehydrogenase subunit 4 [Macrocheles glaber]QHQ98517.1 NADH dehydrogenase subunit 4 [Macrocheles glaber]
MKIFFNFMLLLLTMFCLGMNNMTMLFVFFIILLKSVLLVGEVSISLVNMSIMANFFMGDLMSFLLIMMSSMIFVLMCLMQKSLLSSSKELFLILSVVMLLMLMMFFLSSHMLLFYVFFEIVLIPILMMIFLNGAQVERVQAGMYMLMYTVFASLPLLVMIMYFYMVGSYSFFYNFIFNSMEMSFLLLFLYFFAFLVKMPIYGLHMWLPKAHVEAPVVGSMVLAAVLLKMGSFGILRVILLFDFKSLEYLSSFLMSLSLFGAVVVSMNCFFQVDLKALVAYSSVVHMALLMGGILSCSAWGAWGSMMMMLGHGMCSSALFCLISFMYDRFYTRNILMLKGMLSVYPVLTLFWFLFCIINMAAPPFMNLFSEILLLGSIIKWSGFSLVLLMLVSFLSAGYSLYLYTMTQHGKGWFFYSVEGVTSKEFIVLFLHFYPLLFYLLKMELFFNWM